MSEENVELHRRGYDAWNRGDMNAWLALADPDIEFSPFMVEMEGERTYQGRDGARRLWNDWLTTFPDRHIKVDEIKDLGGDATFGAVRLRAHGARSDAPVEQSAWHVMQWRNGKCVRWQAFRDEAEALEAAGLSE